MLYILLIFRKFYVYHLQRIIETFLSKPNSPFSGAFMGNKGAYIARIFTCRDFSLHLEYQVLFTASSTLPCP